MSRTTLAVTLNILGLAMAAWGVSMLAGAFPLFGLSAILVLTGVGLGLFLLSTMLLVVPLIVRQSRNQRYHESDEVTSRAITPTPLRHQDQLVNLMQDLRDSALVLIERRREVYHLDTHQWSYAHRDETSQEIAANKEYRRARNDLELHRLSLPTEFWKPVDEFCDAIDLSISRATYSPPKDRQVYDSIARLWHSAMRGINDVSSGRAVPEEAPQMAD